MGVAALVLVVLAIVFYVRGGREDRAPADKFVHFYCSACKQSFELTERDIDRIWEKHEYGRKPGERELLFKCKHCGKMTAERTVEAPAGNPAGPGADSSPR